MDFTTVFTRLTPTGVPFGSFALCKYLPRLGDGSWVALGAGSEPFAPLCVAFGVAPGGLLVTLRGRLMPFGFLN
jgi:hypothetical protein